MTSARDRLLAVALGEFAERGFDAAVTRAITDAAEVTAPVLYHHFGSKAGLFEAVATSVMDRVIDAMISATAGRPSPAARLDGILDACLSLQAGEPELPRFVVAAPLDLARHRELAGAAAQMNRLSDHLRATFADDPRSGSVALTLVYGLSRSAAHQTPDAFAETVDAVRALAHGGLIPR